MKNTKYLFLGLAFCALAACTAQDFDDYRPLQSTGEVPDMMKQYASERAKKSMNEVQKSNLSLKQKKIQSEHAAQSTFFLDEIMNSGKVVFGDDISKYVNKVADNILKGDEDLRRDLQFFTIKTAVPNAFATASGAVFVSTGLIASVENEAELAFVLCHEIQHYVKKHSLQSYEKYIKLKNQRSFSNFENSLKEYYRFSRENETEADMEGLKLFLKSTYAKNAPVRVFEILKKVNEPYYINGLDSAFVENSLFKISQAVKKKMDKSINNAKAEDEEGSEDDSNDDYNTHPDLDDRIDELNLVIAEDKRKDSISFVVSESEFNLAQKIARHELVYIYLLNLDFGPAYYLAQSLEKIYGASAYTYKTKAHCMYATLMHVSGDVSFRKLGYDVKMYSGGWRSFLGIWVQLGKKELMAVAARELYSISVQFKNDYIISLRESAYKEMQDVSGLNAKNILAYDKTKADSTGSSGKRHQIAAFGQLLSDSAFRRYIKKYKVDNTSTKDSEDDEDDDSETKTSKRKRKMIKAPMSDVVLFAPNYTQNDKAKKKESSKMFDEEAMNRMLHDDVVESSEKLGVTVNIIGGGSRPDISAENLNDYMLMNDWFMENYRTHSISNTLNRDDESNIILYTSQYIAKPMGSTKYLGFMIMDYEVSRKRISYTIAVWNTQSGALEYAFYKSFRSKLRVPVVNAHVYDMLYRLKNRKVYAE